MKIKEKGLVFALAAKGTVKKDGGKSAAIDSRRSKGGELNR